MPWFQLLDAQDNVVRNMVQFDAKPADPVGKNWRWVQVNDPIAPPPQTKDEIYDAVIQQQQVLRAVVLSIIDGTLHSGITPVQAKAAVKANM